MAELTVTVQYESKPANYLLSLLKVTFPLWGLVAPLIAVFATVVTVGALLSDPVSSLMGQHMVEALGLICGCLAVSSLSLFTMRYLSRNRLIVDKGGVQFPFRLIGAFSPWTAIAKIDILSKSDGPGLSNKFLVFYTRGGTRHLPLSTMKPAEVEQLLLAFEMWGSACERDASLNLLQDTLKTGTADEGKLSYTEMWEEELRRRFTSTSFMPLAPGQILHNGTLKVVRQLSLGGLSAVYLCQLEDKKLVVLKEAVVPDDANVEMKDKAKELFEREAKFLLKLKHQGIVSVLDYFTEAGRSYMLLEYVNGQDIRQYVKQNGPQKEDVVLDWAVQIANILKYLHEQDPPIIHRDLSPDNLVVRQDTGAIVVIDFGAANEFLGKATGTFVGKQCFISPEQFRGKAVTQSDIYAFGCTLFFALTGRDPEALSTSSPKEFNADISNELNEVIESCTQMEPRDRFQSAAQLIPVLRKLSSTGVGS